jgi:hypothetical protein
MMGQFDIDALRVAFESVGRSGPDALARLLDPKVEWFGIRRGQWDCHSRADVVRTIREQVAPGVDTQVAELVEVGDNVVVGVRSGWPGREQEPVFYRVLTLHDGKITRMQDCPDRLSALQTAGASGSGSV